MQMSKSRICSPVVACPILEECSGAHDEELKRHPDLWFEDGSIILRAENTLFKVHMSQLSRHSVFFRDMFSLPQPKGECASAPTTSDLNGNGSKWDGCPFVYLHDAAEDVGNLMTALYDGPSFGNNDQDDFRIVSGILRLSTKYIVDSLRAKALAHLSTAWPSTLKGWDAREDLARIHEMEASNTTHLYPSPIAVINLSREVDSPSLLPSAFYDLSRFNFSQILEPNDDDPIPNFPSQTPSLSLSDMQKLALGKESSHHAITTLIQAMGNSQHLRHAHAHPHSASSHFRTSSSAARMCVSAAACRKDFSELVDLATQHYLFDRERGCSDPLYVAEELGQLKSAEFSECKACAKSLESWAARERQKIWKLIPIWFRLEVRGDAGFELGEDS